MTNRLNKKSNKIYTLDHFKPFVKKISKVKKIKILDEINDSSNHESDSIKSSEVLSKKIITLLENDHLKISGFKIKVGQIHRLRKGLWIGKPPIGYSYVPTGERKFELVCNRDAKMIKRIFELAYNKGFSIKQIVKELNKTYKKTTLRQCKKLLRNPFYCGVIIHSLLGDEIVEGLHTPIVSREVFLKVNGVIS